MAEKHKYDTGLEVVEAGQGRRWRYSNTLPEVAVPGMWDKKDQGAPEAVAVNTNPTTPIYSPDRYTESSYPGSAFPMSAYPSESDHTNTFYPRAMTQADPEERKLAAATTRSTVCGLRRKVFYIVLGVGLLVAVAAIAIGVGAGIAFGNKSNNTTPSTPTPT